MQTNMVSTLFSVIGCIEISHKYYMIADTSYECYDSTHIKYILIICVPGLLFWAVLLPFFILRSLINHKRTLDYALVRLRFGFLY